ncbi:hypothetical protein DV515_00016881 [Chloebia gouldiae]|uniref:Uncharacterized protein n=1 Tax=Chloebia gouldiae TaxID=44316 RepID=A0A3L8RBT5_CHLGU|nr:hypothetical protein DV515_00016881 [Chloebia gouldiae]
MELPGGGSLAVTGGGSEGEGPDLGGAPPLPGARLHPCRLPRGGPGELLPGEPPPRTAPRACKTSVGTQCDPEEIIVLSDSD